MIPRSITKDGVLKAISWVEDHGVPKKHWSKRYHLRHEGHNYPPKFLIFVTHRLISNEELSFNSFNAIEAKNYLIKLKFEVTGERGQRLQLDPMEEDNESSFPEGAVKYGWHRYFERDSKFVRGLKSEALADLGDLVCAACGFSFGEQYGIDAIGYIEAHHTKPVSTLRGKRGKTKEADIAFVCSNCHRMLHHLRPWLSIQQLRDVLRRRWKDVPEKVDLL